MMRIQTQFPEVKITISTHLEFNVVSVTQTYDSNLSAKSDKDDTKTCNLYDRIL